MNIEQDKQVVRGKHKEYEFTLNGGVLEFRGQSWSKKGIQTLVELGNLLTIQGYDFVAELPKPENNGNTVHWRSYLDPEDFGG